jgi:transposase
MMSSRMAGILCIRCAGAQEALAQARAQIDKLEAELAAARHQVHEVTKAKDLMQLDLDRLVAQIKGRMEPNQPERSQPRTLQLAFDEVLAALEARPELRAALEAAAQVANDDPAPEPTAGPGDKRKHGRRKLSLEDLPVREHRVTPAEVLAVGGEGWQMIDEEVAYRLGFEPARFVNIRVIREKWVKVSPRGLWRPDTMVTAPLPAWALPRTMADTSLIADIVVAKYGFSLPLHRQEQIHRLHGFEIARSTMWDWLETFCRMVKPVVAAMHAESLRESYVIATDATGAPVRVKGGRAHWHLFVFIADAGHITFIPTRRHSSAAIKQMLGDFQGRLMADASSIYDALRLLGVVLVACWAHVRRYFWKATLTEPQLANQGMALLQQLFAIERETKRLPKARRSEHRVRHAGPVVEAMDAWVELVTPQVEPDGRMQAALTYYKNQREALGRFLKDDRLGLDNNSSEQQLRNLVMGLNNWQHFETKAGLECFALARSLIASCRLHGLNQYDYLERMLRLVRHWPGDRSLDLSPRYWQATLDGLSAEQRRIVEPDWKRINDPPGTQGPAPASGSSGSLGSSRTRAGPLASAS